LTSAGVMAVIEMIAGQPCRQGFKYLVRFAGTIGLQEGCGDACGCPDYTSRGYPIPWRYCLVGKIDRCPGLQHRSFIDWHIACLSVAKDHTVEPPAIGLQLLARTQQRGVIGQMQHRRGLHTPGVFHCCSSSMEDGHTTVDHPGKFSGAG